MSYDYRKLKGKIIEKFGTQSKFAEKLGVSERTLSLKLNNKVYWVQDEITKACKLLGISENEAHKYFFEIKVQLIEQ